MQCMLPLARQLRFLRLYSRVTAAELWAYVHEERLIRSNTLCKAFKSLFIVRHHLTHLRCRLAG